MKKHFPAIPAALITLLTILITAFVFSACSRNEPADQASGAVTQEYVSEADIYGRWRYVKAMEDGETFYEEYATSILNLYYIDDSNMLLETSFGFNRGYFYSSGENWFNFSFDAGPPMIFRYDSESKYLVWLDHTMEFYYEWVGPAGDPPQVGYAPVTSAEEIIFFVDYALIGYWTFKDGHYIYAGNDGEELIIYCNVDMHDFIIYSVDYHNDKLIIEGEKFNQIIIPTDYALIYRTYVSEGIPNEAFFFRTADGNQHSYIIQYSGVDGGIFVTEYSFF